MVEANAKRDDVATKNGCGSINGATAEGKGRRLRAQTSAAAWGGSNPLTQPIPQRTGVGVDPHTNQAATQLDLALDCRPLLGVRLGSPLLGGAVLLHVECRGFWAHSPQGTQRLQQFLS